MTPRRIDGPQDGAKIVLAHGAGAPMDSPFLEHFARALAARGLCVVRFEFPYMRARREGRRPPPDREPVLLACWREVIAAEGGGGRVVIGGKSLGGRMASRVADEVGARGLVCLGYPFHPPGKPERLRVSHLAGLRTPALILQGTRDPFGNREEVAAYALSAAIRVHWIEDGDHSLKPRASSGRSEPQNLDEAAAAIAAFVGGLGGGR
ncbi:MAG: alpha/beta fold hydrolase [Deltaproteobacteria bacterium]|nr:alpha/beta fold hydrolase [Deltaproteobacteria bacterium]